MSEFQKWWDETYGQILTITNDPDADASCRIAKIAALDAWKAGIAALEAERDALRADAERFREILEAVVRELPGYRRDDGNAPGHGHRIPGIWDEHNGAKTGKPCAWCKTWSLARAAIAAKEPKA